MRFKCSLLLDEGSCVSQVFLAGHFRGVCLLLCAHGPTTARGILLRSWYLCVCNTKLTLRQRDLKQCIVYHASFSGVRAKRLLTNTILHVFNKWSYGVARSRQILSYRASVAASSAWYVHSVCVCDQGCHVQLSELAISLCERLCLLSLACVTLWPRHVCMTDSKCLRPRALLAVVFCHQKLVCRGWACLGCAFVWEIV